MLNFQQAVSLLKTMEPGQRLEISCYDLYLMPYPIGFPPQDWLLERIIGSAYEYRYELYLFKDSCMFERLLEPLKDDKRTYISPDRRHLYKQDIDGFWVYKG